MTCGKCLRTLRRYAIVLGGGHLRCLKCVRKRRLSRKDKRKFQASSRTTEVGPAGHCSPAGLLPAGV